MDYKDLKVVTSKALKCVLSVLLFQIVFSFNQDSAKEIEQSLKD